MSWSSSRVRRCRRPCARRPTSPGCGSTRNSVRFSSFPAYYAIASTRPIEEIADKEVLNKNEIGFAHVRMVPSGSIRWSPNDEKQAAEYREAAIRLKQKEGNFVLVGERRRDLHRPLAVSVHDLAAAQCSDRPAQRPRAAVSRGQAPEPVQEPGDAASGRASSASCTTPPTARHCFTASRPCLLPPPRASLPPSPSAAGGCDRTAGFRDAASTDVIPAPLATGERILRRGSM